jgi:hypothetical protein
LLIFVLAKDERETGIGIVAGTNKLSALFHAPGNARVFLENRPVSSLGLVVRCFICVVPALLLVLWKIFVMFLPDGFPPEFTLLPSKTDRNRNQVFRNDTRVLLPAKMQYSVS